MTPKIHETAYETIHETHSPSHETSPSPTHKAFAQSTTQANLFLGARETGCDLVLTPAANGGWAVYAHDSRNMGMKSILLGSFTDKQDLVLALRESL